MQAEAKTAEDIYKELIENLNRYHPSKDFSLVEKAYTLASAAHENQRRKSGEPYIIHPLSVAVILSELELDIESIVAGILHDVIEDTAYTHEDIERLFGEDVADLVEGVTKLDKLSYSSKEEAQAENFRKLFLAMAKDIRVILIKIADRLHNMRTLGYMTEAKQKEIALETIDIYAPLAERLGITKLRYEIEDLSLRYLRPEVYYKLAEEIRLKQAERFEYVEDIVETIHQKLTEANIDAKVYGRPKHFFSIYRKMISQDKKLDQIMDLFAIRIIVNDVHDCYSALGVVHTLYTPRPGRFKDYIAMRKPNGYQSIHNTLMGPGGEQFEVQIRTYEMHRNAEYGIAAHWRYKQGKSGEDTVNNEEAKLEWLRHILEWQQDSSDNKEYMSELKGDLNVFKESVYCFSPTGEVISLPTGATPIDFAYAIHSALGNRMVGALVDNAIVPYNYALQSGDRVQILTSQNSKGPSRDWLNIVKTSQARSKINSWFKRENKEENTAKGKESLDKEAAKKGYTMGVLLAGKRMDIVLNKYGFQDWDSLCAAVGHGGLKEGQVVNRLIEEYEKAEKKNKLPDAIEKVLNTEEKAEDPRRYDRSSGIIVKGIHDLSVRFSKCCGPVPGDEIIGFITRGRGVSIHRTDCVNVINLDDAGRRRLISAEWQSELDPNISFRAEIKIICNDRHALLADISRVLADEDIEIRSLIGKPINEQAIFNIVMTIANRDQLEKINKKIMNIKGVYEIQRVTT